MSKTHNKLTIEQVPHPSKLAARTNVLSTDIKFPRIKFSLNLMNPLFCKGGPPIDPRRIGICSSNLRRTRFTCSQRVAVDRGISGCGEVPGRSPEL